MLDPVEVIASRTPAALGAPETASEGQVSPERIEARSVYRPGEVLEAMGSVRMVNRELTLPGKATARFELRRRRRWKRSDYLVICAVPSTL